MTDEDELRLEGEAEAEAARRVMALSRWTLNQTIAWIATRNPSALLQGLGSIGLSVWMAVEEVSGRKTDYPFARYEDAWEELASLLADGQLAGIATQTKGSKLGGRFNNALGVRFPPTDQPGFALGCSVFDSDRTGGGPVVAPTNRIFGVEWDEFHDLTFRREDVMQYFEQLPMASITSDDELSGQTEDVESVLREKAQIETVAPQPLSPTHRAIAEAIASLWPDGNFPIRAGMRDAAIQRWIRERQGIAPAARTIQRFLAIQQGL